MKFASMVFGLPRPRRAARAGNFKHLSESKGAPVTAHFGSDGITIVDPNCASEEKVFQRIYEKAI